MTLYTPYLTLAWYEISVTCLFTYYNLLENMHFLLDFGSICFLLKECKRKDRKSSTIFVSVFSLKFMYY